MKISYINSVCVKNDAISNCIRDEIELFRLRGFVDICLFSYCCDHEFLPFKKVKNPGDVAFDPHFQSSDLIVFHFGIFYPLFDLLSVTPSAAKTLVVFHNITPRELVSIEKQGLIDKSFAQMSNIVWAHHVACVSDLNCKILRTHGINTPASIVPIAIPMSEPPQRKPSFEDGIVRIAFLGRFVRAKGPCELLRAIQAVAKSDKQIRLKVDLVGNLFFSEKGVVDDVNAIAEQLNKTYDNRIMIQLHGNASEEKKNSVLTDADLFVLPTYHEGFCVPIVEALGSGCRVITYENSNIPSICGGLAKLVPTGNIALLSLAIREQSIMISSHNWRNTLSGGYSVYREEAWHYVQRFSQEKVGENFMNLVAQISSEHARVGSGRTMRV